MRFASFVICVAICVVLGFLLACKKGDGSRNDWNTVSASADVAMLEAFIDENPTGTHTNDAIVKIDSIRQAIGAQCVSIYYEGEGNYTYVGRLKVSLNGWWESITPHVPNISIFRMVPQDLLDKHSSLRAGCAYLDTLNSYQYLGRVDLSKTDIELARMFIPSPLPSDDKIIPIMKTKEDSIAYSDKWFSDHTFPYLNHKQNW